MKTKASYINNEFYLIRTKNNSTFIYDVSNTNYHEFKESEDIPLAIQERYNAGDFVRALKSLDDKATDKSRLIDLTSIDGDALSEMEAITEKPFITFVNTEHTQKLIDLKEKIEPYYKIVVNIENKKKYYFNHNTKKYELLDKDGLTLGYLLQKDFNITLVNKDITTLYGLFRIPKEPNHDAIAFNNMVLDTDTWQKLPRDTFTVKSINYDYLEPGQTKKGTLTEKTIKEIFIPANAPDNTQYYKDFLQRLGASFKKENKHKFIYLLSGSGDDGKSLILDILGLIHGKLALNLEPKNLDDDFYNINLSDTNVLLMDELNKGSFNNDRVATLKLITGRGAKDSRLMHSQELVTTKNYGVLFIGTNVIPSVPFSDKAYWKRLIIIKLPNKFIEDLDKPDLANNIYIANEELNNFLADDVDGLEWLISEAINHYKNMVNGFEIKQSALDTQFLYDGDNPIKIFITNYIIKTNNNDDLLANNEIKYYLLSWALKIGVTKNELGVETPNELSQEIGAKIKNVFEDIEKGRKGSSTAYRGLALNIDPEEYLKDDDNIITELNVLQDIYFNG